MVNYASSKEGADRVVAEIAERAARRLRSRGNVTRSVTRRDPRSKTVRVALRVLTTEPGAHKSATKMQQKRRGVIQWKTECQEPE